MGCDYGPGLYNVHVQMCNNFAGRCMKDRSTFTTHIHSLKPGLSDLQFATHSSAIT